MELSIIIPAHNEEKFITNCLNSIVTASNEINENIEIVVVLNRCTDKTEEIAKSFGAVIVVENDKNLSKIRNVGVRASSGDVIITIDADSWMSINLLKDIKKNIATSKYIGGAVQIRPERFSIGILLSCLFIIIPIMLKNKVSLGVFWCHKKTFQAINGFDENLLTAEDVDFAVRLKKYAKHNGMAFKTINSSFVTTSCRKWDLFGDWYMLRNLKVLTTVFNGRNRDIADRWWYDIKR